MEDPYPGDVGIFGITGLLANGIESDVAVKIIIFAIRNFCISKYICI